MMISLSSLPLCFIRSYTHPIPQIGIPVNRNPLYLTLYPAFAFPRVLPKPKLSLPNTVNLTSFHPLTTRLKVMVIQNLRVPVAIG